MLYSFAKILMTTGLRFFYRHIHVTGLENIPAKGPAIIIANHNASLMDAALLGILLKRKAWFFARGDVFAKKPVQTILWWLHMMPVHSYTGGRKTLTANNDSFSAGRKILAQGGIVVFFPESTSHIEHQLLPFRKGVFRLAFDAAADQQFSFDIPIVPAGITYEHPMACRTTADVHFGKPVLLSHYVALYKTNPAAALLHICKDAQQAVAKLVLHVADKNRLQAASHYITLSRSDNPVKASSWKINAAAKLERERAICTTVNAAAVQGFDNKEQQLKNYFDTLAAAGITDKTVRHSPVLPAWKTILLWLGFPVYIIGLALNGLPVLLARWIVDKKVYRKDFYSWIFVACYSFMYFFWLLLVLTVALLAGWQYSVGLLLLMIATGVFAYVYKDWLHENSQQKKWRLLDGNRAKELSGMRASLYL